MSFLYLYQEIKLLVALNIMVNYVTINQTKLFLGSKSYVAPPAVPPRPRETGHKRLVSQTSEPSVGGNPIGTTPANFADFSQFQAPSHVQSDVEIGPMSGKLETLVLDNNAAVGFAGGDAIDGAVASPVQVQVEIVKICR